MVAYLEVLLKRWSARGESSIIALMGSNTLPGHHTTNLAREVVC